MRNAGRIGALLLAGCAGAAGFVCAKRYVPRIKTVKSIRRHTENSDFNLYSIDVRYPYSLQRIIGRGLTDTQSMVDAFAKESFPFLPVHIEAPQFGCSAFCMKDARGKVLMGRNYDFKNDTSALMVHCRPEGGYESVAFAALDNLSANDLDKSGKTRIAALAAPFVCLDGINEKGVSIATLTLDSQPVCQHTGKPAIGTPLAVRLVLDEAATTEEAVRLLSEFDMFATSGRDYHFYIVDAKGDGRAVEWDCSRSERPLVATPVRTVTNFYALHSDKVVANQKNGIYGHGKERFEKIEAVLDGNASCLNEDIAWQALRASSQLPNENDITSNTQWSVVYNNTDLVARISIRRDWDQTICFDVTSFR